MTDIKKVKTIKLNSGIETTIQPSQLDLFRIVLSDSYSNTFELYQSLPDVVVGKQDKYRNEDGSAKPINRNFVYKNKEYKFKMLPGYVESNGQDKAYFKGIKEELVERAVHKLAVDSGYFHNNTNTEDFALVTTIYQIRKELKKHGKTYNTRQVKESLMVLSTMSYVLDASDIDNEAKLPFSPLRAILKHDNVNKDSEGKEANVLIYLNPLISKNILSEEYKHYNYKRIMEDSSYLSRWLLTRLYTRFTFARQDKTYHFLLSTLLSEGVMAARPSLSTNIKEVEEALKSHPDILQSYTVETKEDINPKSKRARIYDAKFTITPSESFIKEQIRINAHEKSLKDAVTNEDGRKVARPWPEQFDNAADYKRAERQFIELKKKLDN